MAGCLGHVTFLWVRERGRERGEGRREGEGEGVREMKRERESETNLKNECDAKRKK